MNEHRDILTQQQILAALPAPSLQHRHLADLETAMDHDWQPMRAARWWRARFATA
jgi:hypothetical protein